jgi:tetraacyldisaccharide 4'-kinase
MLEQAWLRRGPLACLLWPVSLVYRLVVALRRSLYRSGMLTTERVDVPVIVVGNVVAGGAGKTPVVMAVVEHLRSRGLAPGVVSRGHGRRTADCREVTAGSNAADVGDEPLLIARRCGVPVFVAARRIEAARALRTAHPQTSVIVCDDGLQHLALERDIEICVFDARGAGNGWLLPAGPLREPWPRPADLVLRSGPPNGIEGLQVRRRLAGEAVRADGQRVPLEQLKGQPLIAVAGIANPQAFFDMLQARGIEPSETIALADHYDFDSAPRMLDAGYSLICTEKDAVKLWRSRPDAWAVALVLDIDPAFWSALDRLLEPKLSFEHGPQTS